VDAYLGLVSVRHTDPMIGSVIGSMNGISRTC
jgi:hypothetical protein